jgi:hypothetical protein
MCPWYYDGRVKLIYSNPFKITTLRKDLGASFYYDLVIVAYGKPAHIAEFFTENGRPKFGHWISLHGSLVYDFWGNATKQAVGGDVVGPIDEDSPLLTDDGTFDGTPYSWNPKLDRMIVTEQQVRRLIPDATILRVGGLYGPYDLFPTIFPIVKRVVDKRPFIILSESHANR